MFHSMSSLRTPVSGPLAMLLFGIALYSLCLRGAFAEQEDLPPQAELTEVQAELEALQDSYDESLTAREKCDRSLNIATGRIEGLEAMLGRFQGSASGDPAGTAGRAANTWSLVERLLALSAEGTEQGIRLSLPQEELVFRSGTAELPSGEMPSLDQIATVLADHQELDALVEGHTDSAGPAATNMALSQERADAVRQALIDRGVEPDRLAAKGIGESRPVATNATSTGRQLNRRVEIYLTP